MAKFKKYDYAQSVLIPVSLEDQLIPGTLEFAIHTLVETRMDTSIFDNRYNNDERGCSAYDPKILLKVVLFGYSRGLISSRRLERACRENVIFMALSCQSHPDHSTIAEFVSSMKDVIFPLFRNVLMVCEEEDLLGGTFFALDGCKLSSNASKEMSGKISDIRKKKEKIEHKVKQLLDEHIQEDKKDKKAKTSSIISSREKQIDRLQKRADRITDWLKENGPKIGKLGREIKSNVTDNESALMTTSHGVIQGYNGQALVDKKHQVIIHAEAFGEGQDHHHIPPLIDGAKENMEAIGLDKDYFEGKTFAADSNYYGPTNLKKCDEEKLDAYIPDKDFRNRDERFQVERRKKSEKTDRFELDDFKYNKMGNEYICPNGKTLYYKGKSPTYRGGIAKRYRSKKKDCDRCQLSTNCLEGKTHKSRTIRVPIDERTILANAMQKKIDSEEGRTIYHQRLAIVEPVFSNIRFLKQMDRFTLRGKVKVNIQWLLFCMIHNIGKIVNYGHT